MMGMPVKNACDMENTDKPMYFDSLKYDLMLRALMACHTVTTTTTALTAQTQE